MGVTRSYLSHSFVCTLAREILHHTEVSLSKYVADKLKGQYVYSYVHETKAAARSCTNE